MDLMDEEVSLKHQVEVRVICSFVLLICVIHWPNLFAGCDLRAAVQFTKRAVIPG